MKLRKLGRLYLTEEEMRIDYKLGQYIVSKTTNFESDRDN